MIYMTKEQIILLHSLCVSQTGGSVGIRDDGLLDSALNSPMQSFYGKDLYPTVQTKAAALCFSLISNHAFVDGNKRIGMLSMLTVLALNGIMIEVSDDKIVELGLAAAQGKANIDEITEWIIKHTQ